MADEFNHFSDIADKLSKVTGQVVRKTVFDIQAEYVSRAARDTGFMVNSAYVETSEESTYGQGGIAGKGDSYLLPEVETPEDNQTAYMAIGANYAIYPESGTRFQPAQPAFYPAVEAVRPEFEAAMAAIESKLGKL